MILQSSIHGGIFLNQILVLSELFSSKRLFLCAPHALCVVIWVVRQHKRESCLIHVLNKHHRQRKMSMSDCSKIQRHRCCISNYQSMYNKQSFCCLFSVNLWKYGCQKKIQGIPWHSSLPPPFCLTTMLLLTAGSFLGTTRIICKMLDVDKLSAIVMLI